MAAKQTDAPKDAPEQPGDGSDILVTGPNAEERRNAEIVRQADKDVADTLKRFELPPLQLPERRLLDGMVPEITATLTLPKPYPQDKDHCVQFSMWVNPPENVIIAVGRSKALYDFLFYFMRGWSLRFAPAEKGQKAEPVPFEREYMEYLPEQTWDWLMREFRERRAHPLPTTRELTTEAEEPKDPSPNGTS